MRSWSPSVYKPLARNVVFYDGPSQLNGERILGVVTHKSTNPKIGRMVQAWIIPATSPIAAVKSGADAAVCGDCKLRGEKWKGRSCYAWIPGVDNIWQSIQKADRTDHLTPEHLARRVDGLQLRIGRMEIPLLSRRQSGSRCSTSPPDGRPIRISTGPPRLSRSAPGAWPASTVKPSNETPRRAAGAPSAFGLKAERSRVRKSSARTSRMNRCSAPTARSAAAPPDPRRASQIARRARVQVCGLARRRQRRARNASVICRLGATDPRDGIPCGLTVNQTPWMALDALFIGGSTAWKLSPHVDALLATAGKLDLWRHVGRVNTRRRMRHFFGRCESIDGSGFSRWPKRGRQASRWLTEIEQAPPLHEVANG